MVKMALRQEAGTTKAEALRRLGYLYAFHTAG